MDKNKVTELLTDYRSYRYAATNLGLSPVMGFTRIPRFTNGHSPMLDAWDSSRYSHIVTMVDGAVNEVLSDDQRTVIMRKYIERNTATLNEIADQLHKDRSTVSRWHTEAIRRLSIALEPLTETFDANLEIRNLDHMFTTTKHQDTA